MKLLDLNYYYILRMHNMAEKAYKVSIAEGVDVSVSPFGNQYLLYEVIFDKKFFHNHLAVKEYWLFHQISIQHEETPFPIKNDYYIHVSNAIPGKLTFDFEMHRNESMEDIKKWMTELYSMPYSNEDYIDFHYYFEKYYRNDHNFIRCLYDDFSSNADYLKLLEKSEEMAIIASYKEKYTHLSFDKKEQVNTLYDLLPVQKGKVHFSFSDGDLASFSLSDKDSIYSRMIKMVMLGGQMLIQYFEETQDAFELYSASETGIVKENSETCEKEAAKWLFFIEHHPVIVYRNAR